jgi:tripartite-type tricarboxylate transporter receptor subunit TctC
MRLLFALLICAALPAAAHAQNYPVKPVVVILPFAAGGGMDNFLRPLAQRFTEAWGRPVIVDYRTGASGNIGSEHVVRSAPDGYTLLASSSSLTINAFLYPKLGFDALKDLVPVSGLIRDPFGIAVSPGLSINTVPELVALAKSKPGQLSYATFGIGSPVHLLMEMLQSASGIRLNHIPYKGSGPATIDVSAGRVDMIVNNSSTLAQHSRAGKVRLIAVSSAMRSPLYPDIPTIAESVPGIDAVGWWGLHAPAAVPRSIVERINADARKILADPAFRAKTMDSQGYEPLLMTLSQFDEFLKGESTKWSAIIRNANIKVEQ